MEASTALVTLLAGLSIIFVVFLVIREIVLWYFRINQIADNIAYIANHYRAIDQATEQQRVSSARPSTAPAGKTLPAGIRTPGS